MMIKRNESVVFDCMTKGYPVPKVSKPIIIFTIKQVNGKNDEEYKDRHLSLKKMKILENLNKFSVIYTTIQ